MTKFTGFFVKALALLVAAFYLIGSPAAVTGGYRDEKPEGTLLAFNVISDTHIETNNKYRKNVYIRELRNMKEYSPADDALCMLGDNTMNSQLMEHLILNGLTDKLFPTGRRILVCGNHDSGNNGGSFKLKYNRYQNFYNWYNGGEEIDRGWFSTEINGYTFICLCSEEDTDFLEYVSREQYDWFCETLKEAAGKGKPVFVLNHYPETWMIVEGDDELDIQDELLKYDNVFYFNGHLHPGDLYTYKNSDSNYSFMLPRITECDEEDGETYDCTGLGLSVYVTGTEVIFRTINFYTAELVNTLTVPIV